MSRARRPTQSGFTLIELMIALVISALLVGLMFAIFLRLSSAYRSQQQVAGVQQVLASARAAFELDAKHAGAYMADGFTMADGMRHSPVVVVNDNAGPDQIGFYYGDATVAAAVLNGAAIATKTVCDVDQTAGFATGDLVVMSTPSTMVNPANGGETIAVHNACVLQILNMTATQFTFSTAAPWGSPGNAHCLDVPPGTPVPVTTHIAGPPAVATTRIYKLVARSYRIDPARPGEGVLQVSPSGNLTGANDWRDLGFGFTDIQVATHFYEYLDVADPDLDGNPERDWYSGPGQAGLTQPVAGAFGAVPYEMTISLVARTERDIEGIASTATPALIVGGADFNPLGDRPLVDLTTTVDPTLLGERIYRFTSFRVDLRNLGVGR